MNDTTTTVREGSEATAPDLNTTLVDLFIDAARRRRDTIDDPAKQTEYWEAAAELRLITKIATAQKLDVDFWPYL